MASPAAACLQLTPGCTAEGAAPPGLLPTQPSLASGHQSLPQAKRTRGIERDASYGTRTHDEAVAFWDDWMTEEDPFLAADPPWERAGLFVLGTPTDEGTWVATIPTAG